MPLGRLLSDVADHHRLLCSVLDRDGPEINVVWEVQQSSAPCRPDGDYESLALSYNCQFISVVDFGLRGEPYSVGDFHPRGYAAAHDVDVGACLGHRAGGLRLFAWDHLEQFRIGGNNLDGTGNFIFISKANKAQIK